MRPPSGRIGLESANRETPDHIGRHGFSPGSGLWKTSQCLRMMEENIYIDFADVAISPSNSDGDSEPDHLTAGWYWGNLSKLEVSEQLQNQADGSYLVRDASSPGDFTLTIKKGGVNKLVKIYHRNGLYGFSEPYEFRSLTDLIQYYSTKSLSRYNPKLDVKLLYPVERSKRDSYEDDAAKKKKDYRELVESIQQHECRLEILYDEQTELQTDLQNHELMEQSLNETLIVYEEQVNLHRQFHGSVSSLDIQNVRDNFNSLLARLQDIVDVRLSETQEIGRLVQENRRIVGEISELKTEIRTLARGNLRRRRWLVDTNTLPHAVEDTWMVGICTRNEAKLLLKGKCPGTFLIRKSEKANIISYVLSIVDTSRLVHIKIIQKDTGYGLSERFCIHPSLMDLVLHYEAVSIAEHNSSVDTMLQYPARNKDIENFYESEPIYGL